MSLMMGEGNPRTARAACSLVSLRASEDASVHASASAAPPRTPAVSFRNFRRTSCGASVFLSLIRYLSFGLVKSPVQYVILSCGKVSLDDIEVPVQIQVADALPPPGLRLLTKPISLAFHPEFSCCHSE